jgi:ABC-type dipeptide/oligopeptide/nickel transport system permease component
MKRYIARRLLQAIPTIFLASIVIFLMIYLIPGDPASVILGQNATPKQVEATKKEMGLDKPLPVQYVIWLGRVVRGDLGESFINGFPVSELLKRRLAATVQLTVAALLIATVLALVLSIVSVIYRGRFIDRLIGAWLGLSYAVPTFWLGVLLIILFSTQLDLLPPTGYESIVQQPGEAWRYLLMPALTLGIYASSVLARFLRSSLFDVIGQDFIRTAQAKGLRERQVLFRHAMKNALIPVVTVLGVQFGTLLGGAVVTEAVFDWPGVGQMLLYAIRVRDYTVVQGTVMFLVVAFVLINLLTDLAYGVIDPRIRYD